MTLLKVQGEKVAKLPDLETEIAVYEDVGPSPELKTILPVEK